MSGLHKTLHLVIYGYVSPKMVTKGNIKQIIVEVLDVYFPDDILPEFLTL